MKKLALPAAIVLAGIASPAHATGGLVCETAGSNPVTITLGFGHVPSAGLFLAKLVDNGRDIPVDATQWWMQGDELRLALVGKERLENEAILVAEWNESADSYDGSIWRKGKKRWVRCREG